MEVIKSALVVPIVACVVVVAGWGLVRCAEMRQAKLGVQEPQPQETAKDGSLVLKLWAAATQGDIRVHGGPKPSLSNWTRADEFVAWHFPVEKPGRYAVELELACAPKDAGSTVRIELANATLKGTIPSTGSKSEFQNLRLGEIDIPAAGWHVLRIVPVKVAHQSVMTLGSVKLVPIKSL